MRVVVRLARRQDSRNALLFGQEWRPQEHTRRPFGSSDTVQGLPSWESQNGHMKDLLGARDHSAGNPHRPSRPPAYSDRPASPTTSLWIAFAPAMRENRSALRVRVRVRSGLEKSTR